MRFGLDSGAGEMGSAGEVKYQPNSSDWLVVRGSWRSRDVEDCANMLRKRHSEGRQDIGRNSHQSAIGP